MKLIILSIFILLTAQATAQEEYPILKSIPDTIFKSDIQKIQYCLAGYYKERQLAYTLAGFSFACAGMGTICLYNKTDNLGSWVAYSISTISAIASAITFYDSEKWLKRASISISPISLKINF